MGKEEGCCGSQLERALHGVLRWKRRRRNGLARCPQMIRVLSNMRSRVDSARPTIDSFQTVSRACHPTPPLFFSFLHPTMSFKELWLSFVRFVASLFHTTPSLPTPVTSRPTSVSVRWVKEPSPLKPPTAAATSSTARSSPACRARSATPKRVEPELPPAGPFPTISLSGLFASPPHTDTPSLHTTTTPSPAPTPSTVRLDRSPTTMSDGSLEVISLGSPVKLTHTGRLPSPWSPIGKTSPNVWMSVGGVLVNATGPVVNTPIQSQDDSLAPTSPLDAFGISVFVKRDATPKTNQARDDKTCFKTPRRRRDTLPAVCSARTIKQLSTPMTKRDNIDVSHVRSATSISSMAYELRMGLFADGRSISAFDNIIPLLDQASPESTPPLQPMLVV